MIALQTLSLLASSAAILVSEAARLSGYVAEIGASIPGLSMLSHHIADHASYIGHGDEASVR